VKGNGRGLIYHGIGLEGLKKLYKRTARLVDDSAEIRTENHSHVRNIAASVILSTFIMK
jgi:hypothetical protein